MPVRIPKGTPRETIGSVLNAYNGWLNAGSELVTAWSPGRAVPENCAAELAARNAEAYASTLFTTHRDVASQEYFAAVKVMNQQISKQSALPSRVRAVAARSSCCRRSIRAPRATARS